jgi:phosphatidylinositol glycan class F
MATRRTSKKVSFDSASKIVEISEEEAVLIEKNTIENSNSISDDDDDGFDPDKLDIDLTTGKKKRGIKIDNSDSNFTVMALSTSAYIIPFHLPFLLISLLYDGQIMSNTREGIQTAFYNLSILSLIYSVMVGEVAKCEKNPSLKSSGPTGTEFLYTSISYPISILLSIPLYLTFLLFGAPAGPLTALTFYLASHVSLIVFYPLLNVYKLTDKNVKKTWWKLLTFQIDNWKLNQVYCSSIGGLIGCWLGVIPIPLDWDRDWQDWPITLLIGAYGGAFIGNVASYIYGRYVMSKFTKNT